MKWRVRGRQNNKNSSTLDINCGKSIYLIILYFFVVIDTWLVLAKHILDCMYHRNSRTAAKPGNQPFKGEKVNKMEMNRDISKCQCPQQVTTYAII